jgi:hypothetical protein
MRLCGSGHTEIAFQGADCPACAFRRQRTETVRALFRVLAGQLTTAQALDGLRHVSLTPSERRQLDNASPTED